MVRKCSIVSVFQCFLFPCFNGNETRKQGSKETKKGRLHYRVPAFFIWVFKRKISLLYLRHKQSVFIDDDDLMPVLIALNDAQDILSEGQFFQIDNLTVAVVIAYELPV